MRAEQKDYFAAILGRKSLQPLADSLCYGLDEPVVNRPAIHDAPLECLFQAEPIYRPPEIVETRSRGCAGELWVLSKGDGALDSVCPHRLERVLARGPHITERDIEARGCVIGRQAIEPIHQPPALGLGVPEDRRAATDRSVELPDCRRAATSNERPEPLLKG